MNQASIFVNKKVNTKKEKGKKKNTETTYG